MRLTSKRALSEHEDTVVLRKRDTAMFHKRLGEVLLEAQVIAPAQLKAALDAQRQTGEKLGAVLVGMGVTTEQRIAQALGRQLQLEYTELDDERIDPSVARLVDRNHAASRCYVVLRIDQGRVVVAMADPLDLNTVNELEATFGGQARLLVSTEGNIRRALERAYGAL